MHILSEGLLDLAASVQNGAVIVAAEIRADLLQRQLSQLASQIHPNLAWQQRAARSTAGLQLPRLNLEITADPLGNPFHSRPISLRLDAKLFGQCFHIQRLAMKPRQPRQASDSSFKLASAAREMLGQPGGDIDSHLQITPLDALL